MNLEYKSLLPENFDPASRVWIYQASRLFSIAQALRIEEMLESFTESWMSHGAKVKGYANLFFGRFIVVMADESSAIVSGCSTDSSVRLVKQIEAETGVPMFDRQMLAFIKNEKIELLPMRQLEYAYQNGFIAGDTIFFDNTVMSRKELEERWMVPVEKSWLQSRLQKAGKSVV